VTPAAAALVAAAVVAAAAAGRPAPGSDPGLTPIHRRAFAFVDRSRRARFSNGSSAPRALRTQVLLPAGHGRFPLVVFCHGFALTPGIYVPLLDAWVRAGFVVAAPAFPVERPGAPGGPSRADLPNEPRDVSFVLTRLLRALRGVVDPRAVAVAGQSDGAVAAFSVAYDPRYRDPRVNAAVVMSGAPLAGFAAPADGAPPLLAVQGTADPFNAPRVTAAYFRELRPPKFLLWLLGASHLPPYTTSDRWEAAVAAATTAFLRHYLRAAPLRPLLAAGDRPGVARLVARP